MTNQYIEREVAKRELLSWAVCMNHPEYLMKDDAMHVIDSIPAADVAPVVHAHWQPYEDTVQCSACGFGTFMDGYFFVHGECTHANDRSFRFSFCPNCGARCDGGINCMEGSHNHQTLLKSNDFCSHGEMRKDREYIDNEKKGSEEE